MRLGIRGGPWPAARSPITCGAATALLPQPAGATECCGEVAALKEEIMVLKEANEAKDAEIAAKDAENAALRAALQ